MSTSALYRRIVRRETHSPRSGIAITVAIVLMLALAYLGVESVLAALALSPLLVSPRDAVAAVLSAAAAPVAVVSIGASVVAVVGVILVVVALAPGRRGRRGSAGERLAVVVDDRVIAQSVARTAGVAGGVTAENVRVTVGRRAVRVDLTPLSGRPIERTSIQDAVATELAAFDYRPALRSSVRVAPNGTID